MQRTTAPDWRELQAYLIRVDNELKRVTREDLQQHRGGSGSPAWQNDLDNLWLYQKPNREAHYGPRMPIDVPTSTAQLRRLKEDVEVAEAELRRAKKAYKMCLEEKKEDLTRELKNLKRDMEELSASQRSATLTRTTITEIKPPIQEKNRRSASVFQGGSVSVFPGRPKLEYHIEYCGQLSSDAEDLIRKMGDGYFTLFTLNDNNDVLGMKNNGTYKNSGVVPKEIEEYAKMAEEKGDQVKQIALGSDNRFCLLFYRLTPGCTGKKLKEYAKGDGVRCVAFGRKNVYVVLYDDGSFKGENIPGDLENLLRERKKQGDKAVWVSMGPDGEFFVRSESGKWHMHATDPDVTNLKHWFEERSYKYLVKNFSFGKRAAIAVYSS